MEHLTFGKHIRACLAINVFTMEWKMNLRSFLWSVLCILMFFPSSAFAINSVLSGVFDGSEPKTAALPGTCLADEPLGYLQAGSFQVSESGNYYITDAYNVIGVDISALIYSGSFDPNSPLTNLVTPNGVDIAQVANLSTGVTYVLVVQHWCTNPDRTWVNMEGAWSVTITGPGSVSSGLTVSVPQMTEGSFAEDGPTTATECGDSQYQESGPVRVSTTGTYYYTDISINYEVDMCLQIYSAPFNAANPDANRVILMDDFGSVELESGKDYYFLVQPLDGPQTGEFFYVFAPPAPMAITYAISGSWYFEPTTGQGFLIDVFDSANLMFLAWFTYDLERPADGTNAMIGDPGHRWMTAAGPFQGDTAELGITWSSGMIFDSEVPAVSNSSDGTMTVEFFDCNTGRVSYDLGSSGRTGVVPIERIVPDAVPLCEQMTQNPDKPGPL